MARHVTLELTPLQRIELLEVRQRHAKPYVRERAAALLQVADGTPLGQVATTGLLKRRRLETVSTWVRRYQAHGLGGLDIHSGRGRKPRH